MVLENNLGNAVTVNRVTIEEEPEDVELPLTVGASADVEVPDGGTCSDGEEGDAYSYTVEIEYTDEATGATYTMDGGGETLDDECAAGLAE